MKSYQALSNSGVLQMQGQAYARGADQQTAMGLATGYSRSVNGGDCDVSADPEGARDDCEVGCRASGDRHDLLADAGHMRGG